MRPTALAIAMGALVGAQSSCIVGGAFACTENAECSGDGVCEPTGWCSFPDASCSSGARYSPWAGDAFANDCTDEEMVTTGTTPEEGTTAADSTSGPPVTRDSEGPECGNGITEVGEECDDGDPLVGHGCSGCVELGKVLWTQITKSLGDDEGHDIAVTSEGSCYVVGQFGGGQNNGSGWVVRYEPDGEPVGWALTFGNALEDAALGLAVVENVPDDCLVGDQVVSAVFVSGYENPNDDEEPPEPEQANHFLRRYDAAGGSPGSCWTHRDGSGQTIQSVQRYGDDKLNDVVAGLDEVVAVGHMRFDLRGNDSDAIAKGVELFTNAERWSWTGGLSGDDDFATAGVVDASGRVWAVGRIRNNEADAWIAHIAVEGTSGTRQWTWTSATPQDDRLQDVVLTPEGNLLGVGRRGEHAWISVWTPQTETTANQMGQIEDIEPMTPGAATLYGVAIDGAGAVIVVGEVATADHGEDAWVQKLEPGLAYAIWDHQIDGTAHGDDIARAVAIGPADVVVVVGDRLELADDEDGVDRDVWIEAYEP